MLVDSQDKEVSHSFTPPRSTSPERVSTEREVSTSPEATETISTATISSLKESNAPVTSTCSSSIETSDAKLKTKLNHDSSTCSSLESVEEKSVSIDNQSQQSVPESLKQITSQIISNSKSNCTESLIESNRLEDTADDTVERSVDSPVTLHLSPSSGSVESSLQPACSSKLPSEMNLSLDTRVVNSPQTRLSSPCLLVDCEDMKSETSGKESTGSNLDTSSLRDNCVPRVPSPCPSSESESTSGQVITSNRMTESTVISGSSLRNNSPLLNEMMPTIANGDNSCPSNWLVDKKRRRLMSSSYGSSSASSSASSPPCISHSDDSEDGGCISDSGCDSVSVLDLSLPARKRAHDSTSGSSGHLIHYNRSSPPQHLHHSQAHQVSRTSNTGSSFAALSAVAAAALANALAASSSSSSPSLSEDISLRRGRRDTSANGLCDSEHEVEGEIRANPKKSLIRRYCEYSEQSDCFFNQLNYIARAVFTLLASSNYDDSKLPFSFTCQLTSTWYS